MPPEPSRLISQRLAWAVDPVSRGATERCDRGVADLHVGRVDLKLTHANAQQHLHPLLRFVNEVVPRGHQVVREDSRAAGDLPDYVPHLHLVAGGLRQVEALPLLRLVRRGGQRLLGEHDDADRHHGRHHRPHSHLKACALGLWVDADRVHRGKLDLAPMVR